MCTETSLDLRHFYPADLEIADICQTDHEIQIKIIAHSKDCICPKCCREQNRIRYYGVIANREIISPAKRSGGEKSYLVFCLDEEEEKKADRYYEYREISMEGQCVNAFGKSGTEIYLRFKHCPLIQQQIIFNLNYSPLCGQSSLKPHSYCN